MANDTWSYVRTDFADCPDYYWTERSPYQTSIRAVAAMFEAAKPRTQSVSAPINAIKAGKAPRWATNLNFIDRITGGFYGLSVVGGMQKLGKSTLAMASAIEAAASLEWNVVLHNAEVGGDELGRRLDQYLTIHPSAEDAVNHMRVVSVPRGFRLEDFLEHAVDLAADDRPVLTVIDSINTCAQLMDGSYLDNLRELALWSMMSRRISRGAASFLVVSELNKSGSAKGMNLEYWADMVIRMTGDRKRGWLKMKLAHSRATQGEDEERKMVRVHHTSRFLTEDDIRAQDDQTRRAAGTAHLHLVADEPNEFLEDF
jgi:predicted ATP-dependent serine protease